MTGTLPVEVVPSGWISPAQQRDRLRLSRDGLEADLGGTTRRLPFERLSTAQVWRDATGERHLRVRDGAGTEVARLSDHAWRVPGAGRLADLLGAAGCRVESVALPPDGSVDGPQPQTVAGERSGGPRVRSGLLLVVLHLVVTVAVPFLDVTSDGGEVAGWAGALGRIVGALLVLDLAALAWWWASRPRLPRWDGAGPVRPAGGPQVRRGWSAGAGLGRSGGALVAADGWGRCAVWPSTGPGAAVAVTTDDPGRAVVLVDEAGAPVAVLPVDAWRRGSGTPPEPAPLEAFAAEVAGMLGLRHEPTHRAPRLSPRDTDPDRAVVLTDPGRPDGSTLGLVLTTVGLAFPYATALVYGLSPELEEGPWPAVWFPGLVGLGAVLLGSLARWVGLRRAARGAAPRTDPLPPLVWFPFVGIGLIITFLWWGLALPDAVVDAAPFVAAGWSVASLGLFTTVHRRLVPVGMATIVLCGFTAIAVWHATRDLADPWPVRLASFGLVAAALALMGRAATSGRSVTARGGPPAG